LSVTKVRSDLMSWHKKDSPESKTGGIIDVFAWLYLVGEGAVDRVFYRFEYRTIKKITVT
jgi:hypothetical protein